jgi:2-dehydropantoate 2-reductase
VVFVAVKQHHLAEAIEDLRPFVGGETLLLSLLNGVTSEAILGRALGAENVLPAFVLGNDVVREGTTTRFTSMGRLVFGAPSNDRSDPRVLAVCALLERAGIAYQVPDDIRREQWWKFVLNVGVNQVSAVLRATYGDFRDVPEVFDLARGAMLEAVEVARREGVPLAPGDLDAIPPILARLGAEGKTSMLQDVEAGRKTEVEIFAATVCELGRRHGVDTPVNELLGAMLRALEAMARRGGAGERSEESSPHGL